MKDKVTKASDIEEMILDLLDHEKEAGDWEERAYFKYQRLVVPGVKEACEQIGKAASKAGAEEAAISLCLVRCHAAVLRMILANAVMNIDPDARGKGWKLLAAYCARVACEHMDDYFKVIAKEQGE